MSPRDALYPFAYQCQQGCGEVSIFVTYTDRDGTYYHHLNGERHAVRRERRDLQVRDMPEDTHGPEGR